jgi:hypothetical protein
MTDRRALLERLNAEGYVRCIVLPNGLIAGLYQQLYTTGLVVGLDGGGYQRRYCYEHKADAAAALDAWDGTGDPSGPWIKEKPSDRLGPGATK